jgi:hypothetical protein
MPGSSGPGVCPTDLPSADVGQDRAPADREPLDRGVIQVHTSRRRERPRPACNGGADDAEQGQAAGDCRTLGKALAPPRADSTKARSDLVFD